MARSSLDDHSEEQLIERVRSGDRVAFGKLIEQNTARVYKLYYRLTGDAHEAEGITQEAFLRAFEKAGGFRGAAVLDTGRLHDIEYVPLLPPHAGAFPQQARQLHPKPGQGHHRRL